MTKRFLSAAFFLVALSFLTAKPAKAQCPLLLMDAVTADTTSSAVEVTGFAKVGITFKAATTSTGVLTVQQSIWSSTGPWQDLFTVNNIDSNPRGFVTSGATIGWVRVVLSGYGGGNISAKVLCGGR